MRITIIRSIIFILPLVLLLIGINLFADPGCLYSPSMTEEFAEGILNGHDMYAVSGNIDERGAIIKRIKGMTHSYTVEAVGPSLIMCLSSEMLNTNSFMNFGESGANYYDIMSIIGQLDKKDLLPKRIIITIDTMLFDKAHTEVDKRYTIQVDSAYYMLHKLNSNTADILQNTSKEKSLKTRISSLIQIARQYSQLVRLGYFQSSIELIKKYGSSVFSRVGIVDDEYTGAYWRKDGSYVYTLEVQNQSVETVYKKTENYVTNSFEGQITQYASVDSEFKKNFELLINYLENSGVQVEFFLCPFHPVVYNEIQANPEKWSLPLQIEEYITAYAIDKNIRIIGSYNPDNCGVDETDFYDSRHLRAESLAKNIDFK